MTTPSTEVRDGRTRRAQQSRHRIIEAMIDLVQTGVREPTAEQVAARADLSMRTVFRHFSDMESLYREISHRMLARAQRLIDAGVAADTWQQTLHNVVAKRARLYEEMLPMRLAADALRHRSPFLQQEEARFIRQARDALAAVLPRHLREDRDRFEALDCLLSYETWIRLRRCQGLSPAGSRRVLNATVDAITDH